MRTSTLSRSVIAIASLAIGSAALVAAPANAASASGITRDQVLKIAAEARDAGENTQQLERQVNRMAARACAFELDGWNSFDSYSIEPVAAGNVDGVLITTELHEVADVNSEQVTHRDCTFAVLTTTDAAFALSGNGSVLVTSRPYSEGEESLTPVTTTANAALSGDVFVSTPIFVNDENADFLSASFSATGNATRPFNVTTTQKVATPKSGAAKKAAKKAYAKKLKAAKKAYSKALAKAGKNKSKKAAAKKAYNKRTAAAKAAYRNAIATFKMVTTTTQQFENRPFTANATLSQEVVQAP